MNKKEFQHLLGNELVKISNDEHKFGFRCALASVDLLLEGYAIVPIEPTEEMLEAAVNAPYPAVYLDSLMERRKLEVKTHYKAMITVNEEIQR